MEKSGKTILGIKKYQIRKLEINKVSRRIQYRYYRKHTSPETRLSVSDWGKVLDLWSEKFMTSILEGRDVKLHWGLATLGIRKHIERTFLDRAGSKENGFRSRGNNLHSDFYVARFKWARHKTKGISRGWAFEATQKNRAALRDVMLKFKGHTRYVIQAKRFNKTAKQEYKKKYIL